MKHPVYITSRTIERTQTVFTHDTESTAERDAFFFSPLVCFFFFFLPRHTVRPQRGGGKKKKNNKTERKTAVEDASFPLHGARASNTTTWRRWREGRRGAVGGTLSEIKPTGRRRALGPSPPRSSTTHRRRIENARRVHPDAAATKKFGRPNCARGAKSGVRPSPVRLVVAGGRVSFPAPSRADPCSGRGRAPPPFPSPLASGRRRTRQTRADRRRAPYHISRAACPRCCCNRRHRPE